MDYGLKLQWYTTRWIRLTTVHYTLDQIENGTNPIDNLQQYSTQWIRMTTVQYTMDKNDNGTVHNGSD